MSEDNRIRKRPSIFLRFGIVLLILSLFAFQYIVYQRVTGKRDLEAWMAEMRAKGERFTLEELNIQPRGGDSTAVKEFMELGERLKNLNAQAPISSGGGFSTRKMVVPGRAVVLLTLTNIPHWAVSVPIHSGPATWQMLEQDLEIGRPLLDEVVKILCENQIAYDLDYSKGFFLQTPHLGNWRSIARWLSSRGMAQLKAKDFEGFIETSASFRRLMESLSSDRIMISKLVQIAIGTIWSGLTWQAVQAEGWNDMQLERLATQWNELDGLLVSSSIFEMERVFGGIAMKHYREKMDWDELIDTQRTLESFSDATHAPWVPEKLEGPYSYTRMFLWKNIWFNRETLRHFQLWQARLSAVRILEGAGTWKAAIDGMEKTSPPELNGWFDEFRNPFSNSYSGTDRYLRSVIRFQVEQRFVQAAIALKRFNLKHKKYPISLEELVSEYLAAVPQDPFNGGSYLYRKNPDGSFTLYTMGENGMDDGGDPTGQNWYEGLDCVWPAPASDAEIQAGPKSTGRIVLPQPPKSP